jgi:hypothetical protein
VWEVVNSFPPSDLNIQDLGVCAHFVCH